MFYFSVKIFLTGMTKNWIKMQIKMLVDLFSIILLFSIIPCAMLHSSIAHSIICTRLFRRKMHSDWFKGIEILQGRWQHGEKVGYCYPSRFEKTLYR
jgi:hypothetical protein